MPVKILVTIKYGCHGYWPSTDALQQCLVLVSVTGSQRTVVDVEPVAPKRQRTHFLGSNTANDKHAVRKITAKKRSKERLWLCKDVLSSLLRFQLQQWTSKAAVRRKARVCWQRNSWTKTIFLNTKDNISHGSHLLFRFIARLWHWHHLTLLWRFT